MRSKKDDGKTPPLREDGERDRRQGRNVGDALRAAYQADVSESVPDEMLELLRKLG